jgi:hypothetical protein
MVLANTTLKESGMKGIVCPKCGSPVAKKNGVYDGKQQYKCGGTPSHRFHNPASEEAYTSMQSDLPDGDVFIITCAQNATPVEPRFWKSLLHAKKHYNAQLIVIPIRYKNPTSEFTAWNQDQERWDPILAPYLFEGRDLIHDKLMVLGDIKMQATAVSPISGWESISGAYSAIIGHPKLEMRMVPTPAHALPKMIVTTGACTKKNYTDTRAGKRGEFHHTFGAALVERDGDRFHIRQLNAMRDGTFIDLRKKFTPKGVVNSGPALALVMGDTHVDVVDPDVVSATFTDKDSIVKHMQPEKIVWNDLVDGATVNPHRRSDPFTAAARSRAQQTNVLEEMQRCADFVDKHSPKYAANIIVPSNHDDFLKRWMKTTDWRDDPENAEFYLETALEMIRGGKLGVGGYEGPDPFCIWMKRLCKHAKVQYADIDAGYTIKGINIGMHGHLGSNGARGGLRGYSKLGVKTIIGHAHTPGIIEGAYQVGTSTYLRLEYNDGPSSWLNTHALVYPNGKRTLINVIKGKWRRGNG